MSDAIDRYQLVASGFDQRVKAVRPDQWDAPVTVRRLDGTDVVAHVVNNHQSMAAAGERYRGQPDGSG